jgi:hypothetical protein
VPEGKCSDSPDPNRCDGNLITHYCPNGGNYANISRVNKLNNKDPDINAALRGTASIPSTELLSNKGKWGSWSNNYLATSMQRNCPSYSWTEAQHTDWTTCGCQQYRLDSNVDQCGADLGDNEEFCYQTLRKCGFSAPPAPPPPPSTLPGMTTGLSASEVSSGEVASLLTIATTVYSHEEQDIDETDECGNQSHWTVTITGAANSGSKRPVYARNLGGGCVTNLTAAQDAETALWPLVRVFYNMRYIFIDSVTLENADSLTSYVLINGCYAFFSALDSDATPTQRSSVWPTFDSDGNLVASNPC